MRQQLACAVLPATWQRAATGQQASSHTPAVLLMLTSKGNPLGTLASDPAGNALQHICQRSSSEHLPAKLGGNPKLETCWNSIRMFVLG